MNQNRIHFITQIRAFACVGVSLYHFLFYFFVENKTVSKSYFLTPISFDEKVKNAFAVLQNLLQKYVSLDIGSFAVGLFFLASGYLAAKSLERLGPLKFLRNRAARIYPALILSCVIFLLLAFAYCSIFSTELSINYKAFISQTFLLYWLTEGSNNLHNMFFSIYNLPTWTLEIEIKFYLIIALIYKLSGTKKLWRFFAILLLCNIALMPKILSKSFNIATTNQPLSLLNFQLSVLIAYVDFILIGSVLFWLKEGALAKSKSFLLTLFLFVGFIVFNRFGSTVAISYLYSIVCFVFMMNSKSNKESGITSFLAKISYPLYLVHCIVGYCVMNIFFLWNYNSFHNNSYLAQNVQIAALAAASLLVSIAISYLMHKYVEQKFRIKGKC